jgi:hypothetical protein
MDVRPIPPHGHELNLLYAEHAVIVSNRVSYGPFDGDLRTTTLSLQDVAGILRGGSPTKIVLTSSTGTPTTIDLTADAEVRSALVNRLKELMAQLALGRNWRPERHADTIIGDVLAGLGVSLERRLAGDRNTGHLEVFTRAELPERVRAYLAGRLCPDPWRDVTFRNLAANGH